MKKILLTATLAGLFATSLSAQLNFQVDSTQSWFGYVNTFNVADDAYLFGFSEGAETLGTLQANFNVAGDELTLAPNSRIFDQENGVGDDTDWINETAGTANWYIEANYYQERLGNDALGQTVSFTYTVTENTLITDTTDPLIQKGYTSQAFIKVLDAFGTWATYQSVFGPMTVGTHTIDLVVNDSGLTNTIGVQVGFATVGDIQPTLDPLTFGPNPILDTGVVLTAVPEPSTYALLLGLAGLGLVIYRRRKA